MIFSVALIAGCGGGKPAPSSSGQQDIVAEVLEPDDNIIQQEDQRQRLEQWQVQELAVHEMDEQTMQRENLAEASPQPEGETATQ
jgi:hypothetical protein